MVNGGPKAKTMSFSFTNLDYTLDYNNYKHYIWLKIAKLKWGRFYIYGKANVE